MLWPHEGLARGLCHLKGSLLLAKLVRRDPMDPVDRFMLRTLALVLFATVMFLICWGVSAGAGCSHGTVVGLELLVGRLLGGVPRARTARSHQTR